MAEPSLKDLKSQPVKDAVGKSSKLAARIPRLILEARRVASTVIHGLHGRRRAGSGENFWQYRHFVSGEPAQNIDWRRSARDDHLMCASANGRPRIRSGYGPTVRRRWNFPRR